MIYAYGIIYDFKPGAQADSDSMDIVLHTQVPVNVGELIIANDGIIYRITQITHDCEGRSFVTVGLGRK